MTENPPTVQEWHDLYTSLIRVKEKAPWEWMTEADIFGVQDPETDEIGFVSVMGMAGEHYAVAVYLGLEGLYGFWELQDAGYNISPERLLEVPQLQASFENRNYLHKKDYNIIKKLELKFRGRQAWPMFRAYRPGFVPWFMEAEEARFMKYALEQTMDVALRYREDDTLLSPLDEEGYLVRVPHKQGSTFVWEDRIIRVPPPEPRQISISMNVQEIGNLKQLPQSNLIIEIDFFLVPAAIGERGSRPYYPYLLLLVDAQSGLVYSNETLRPYPSLEAMWGSIPGKVAHQLSRVNIVPKEVRVRSPLLLQLLYLLAMELRFKLEHVQSLEKLDSVKEFLLQRLV